MLLYICGKGKTLRKKEDNEMSKLAQLYMVEYNYNINRAEDLQEQVKEIKSAKKGLSYLCKNGNITPVLCAELIALLNDREDAIYKIMN